MASLPARQTSSSEEDPKKRKRMVSKRESARRSRMRKQQHLDDLIKQVAQLKDENAKIAMQINVCTEQYLKVDGQNTILKAQIDELAGRLRSLVSVLQFIEEFSGMQMDIPEIPEPTVEPWQFPFPNQPIIASASMFEF